MKITVFWDVPARSPVDYTDILEKHTTFIFSKHLLARWFLVELIFSTLKMEVTCSSETSVDTQRTTRRYIPEDGTLHNHRCENLKSYIILSGFKAIYCPDFPLLGF
jgi:hypothetical protein